MPEGTAPTPRFAREAVEHFLGQDNGEKLLPFSYRQIYTRWRAERKRLNLAKDLTVHSFRHSFTSWLANRTGTPLTEVQRVAGHSSVAITQIYVHPDESMLRAGMQRLTEDLVSRWYQEDGGEEKAEAQ